MATLSTVTDPTNQTTSTTPATLTTLTTPTTKTTLTIHLLTTLTDLAWPPYKVCKTMIWSQIKVAKGCHNLQKKSSGRTFCVKVGQKDNLQKFQQNCREWQLANFANNLSRPTIKKETTNCAYQPLGGRQQCSIFQEPLLSPPPLITRQAHCNNVWKT